MEKTIEDQRIKSLERRMDKAENNLEKIDDKLDEVDDKHDSRYTETIQAITELKGTSANTEKNTDRMATSIEGLVSELKESNSNTNKRFEEVNGEVREIKNTLDSSIKDKTYDLEQKKLSNKTVGVILVGAFTVLEVLIRVVAPLIFGG
ncbi:hypothetical protein K4S27_11275 [Staphylococcus epidermidis]|nr:hypothetical protein [Staphylococcus epidermidis]MCG2360213.1 hypothetical protein [Staphylococcus epidermidis]MCG2367211.1 hypothetical protein [Staphylococcus epidermidis]